MNQTTAPAIERLTGPDYAARLLVTASPEDTFAAVSTVEGLRDWWTEQTEGSAEPGGILHFEFPRFGITKFMRVDESARPARVQWTCVGCTHPEWIATTLTFAVAPAGQDGTELVFRHDGLQPQLECYDVCSSGWDYYLPSLASYLNTGTGQPYQA